MCNYCQGARCGYWKFRVNIRLKTEILAERKIVIRRLSVFLLTLFVMVSSTNMVCQAREWPPLTHHVREVTLNGQAPLRRAASRNAVHAHRHCSAAARSGRVGKISCRELYDPSSPSYRHFLTVQEFTARFGPSQEDYDAVIRFAKANGFTVVGGSRDGMDVQLKGSVADIETAFHVTHGCLPAPHGKPHILCSGPGAHGGPAVPGCGTSRVWTTIRSRIPPLVHRNLSVKSNATTGSGPSRSYLGSDMRAAYYGGTALTGAGQNLGLLEYYGYDIADVNTYFTNAGQTNNVPINGISTDGTSLSCLVFAIGCDDTEQTLDMTQAIGMAPGLNSTVCVRGVHRYRHSQCHVYAFSAELRN